MPKLAYIFDQTLPAPTADSEQLMNTVAALSRRGYDCTLFLPASNESENTNPDALRAFYHVDGDFRIELLHSVFPGPRLLEKVVHPALCATLLRRRLRGFDLVYSRNIPALAAALVEGKDVSSDELIAKHAEWAARFVGNYKITQDNINEILKKEIGRTFVDVLYDAGVYKDTPEGTAEFDSFIGYLGEQ